MEGHVINSAFADSDRRTVVQRADVDSFFGSRFEADFVLLRHRENVVAADLLTDPNLSRRLRPRIFLDGRPVQHYFPKQTVPSHHSELAVERGAGEPVRMALKLDPSEMLTALQGKWEISLEKDIRLPALVSLLKAAHLTMFGLMGYSYALTTGGHFLGWEILGRFVADSIAEDKLATVTKAYKHFPQFVNLVRPLELPPEGLRGTISDCRLFICTGTPKPWAFMIFIRTGLQMHAVLIPVMEDDESAARFLRFMDSPGPRFEIRLTKWAGNRWEVSETARMIDWPVANFE